MDGTAASASDAQKAPKAVGQSSGAESPKMDKVETKRKRKKLAAGAEDWDKWVEDNQFPSGAAEATLKSQNVRRHWKSDSDIRRWHQDLTDGSRFDKLAMEVRFRGNPDFGMDQAELVQKHNGLFRQRSLMEKERNVAEPKNAAVELRKIQTLICPKLKAKKKKRNELTVDKSIFEGLKAGFEAKLRSPSMMFADSSKDDDATGNANQQETRQDPDADLEEDEFIMTTSGLLSPYSPYEDAGNVERSWDWSQNSNSNASSTGKKDMASTSMGFFRSSPSSLREEEGVELEQRPNTQSKEGLPKVELRNFALLLYKNGDKHDTGHPVFIHRTPKDMKELVQMCGEGCNVMVGPPEALYDDKLQRLKDLRDVEGGGIFLLKGQEALNPPPGFLVRGHPPGGSMKHLSSFSRANRANAQQLQLAQEAGAPDPQIQAEHMSGRLPLVSGGRSGNSSVRGATWGISDQLQWQLSYGGQVGLWSGRHRDYSKWTVARTSASMRTTS